MKFNVSKKDTNTLLLVDDEPWFIEALAQRLELRGYAPVVAFDARQAMEAFTDGEFDAVVLDLRLPDRDGADVLKDMLARKPDTRVVILTGHGGDDDRDRCLGLGARAFLNKPVSADQLDELLQAQFASGKTALNEPEGRDDSLMDGGGSLEP